MGKKTITSKNILKFFLSVIAILSLTCKDSWSQFIESGNMFNSSIRSLMESTRDSESIVDMLSLTAIRIRSGYSYLQPYRFESNRESYDWEETKFSALGQFPAVIYNQKTCIGVGAGKSSVDLGIYSRPAKSQFRIVDNSEYFNATFAHDWNKFQLKWGAALDITRKNENTYYDPLFAAGWGNMSSVKFLLTLYSRHIEIPIKWKLKESNIYAFYSGIIDGMDFEMIFGDPFGAQIRLIASDKSYRKTDRYKAGIYYISPRGSDRSVGIYIEDTDSNVIRWKAGGFHSRFPGELTLDLDNSLTGQAPVFDHSQDTWDISLSSQINKRLSINGSVAYYFMSGKMNGWLIIEDLPQNFKDAFSDNTVYFSDAEVQGYTLSTGVQTRLQNNRTDFKIGFMDISTDMQINDYAPDAESSDRATKLSLENFQTIWFDLQSTFYFGKYSVGGSFSQAFLIDVKFGADYEPPQESDLKGGRIINIWVGKRF